MAVVGRLDQRPTQMPRSLLGEATTAPTISRFLDGRVKPAGAHKLPRPPEAAGVADLGEQMAGEDRADAEDRLQRPAAPVAARVTAQFALEQLDLLLQGGAITATITSTWARACGSSSSAASQR